MKAYWDSSALVKATSDVSLRTQLRENRGYSRTHALNEMFSALTGGNLLIRLDADAAAAVVASVAVDLEFIDLGAEEILAALKVAKGKGVRDGRVHDFMHAIAAEKSGSTELFTTDRNDFSGLSNLRTVQV